MQNKISIAVGQLVKYVYQEGSFSTSMQSKVQRMRGIVGHQVVQNSRGENYQSEITIKYQHLLDSYEIEINGRIDGIFKNKDQIILEEIKTISDFKSGDPEFEYIFFPCLSEYKDALPLLQGKNAMHWAQALIYAYIWCKQQSLSHLRIQLTYFHNIKNKEYPFFADFSITWLETFFNYTIGQWLDWAVSINNRINQRNKSINNLQFPFEFRKEQRKMAVAVYKAIEQKQILYARAPTGTGKTMASLYPSIKAMGENKIDKVFYLTAKTVGRTVAISAIQMLNKNGAKLKYLVLTAKEKVCMQEFPLCEPSFCEYAYNFFGKLKAALYDIITYDEWNSNLIQEIAERHRICPFELALTLTEYADVVICDYNYVFDPRIMIRRLFDEVTEKYCFLIDEAHNMPDRARSMYSGDLTLELLNSPLSYFQDKSSKLADEVLLLRNNVQSLINSFEQKEILLQELPVNIIKSINLIIDLLPDQIFILPPSKIKYNLIVYYFQLYFYMDALARYGDNYRTIILKDNQASNLKLYCLNASQYINQCMANAVAVAIFSATLVPIDYYEDMISFQNIRNTNISLKSPFKKSNCAVAIYTSLTSEYKMRKDQTYQDIADLIIDITCKKAGNYIVYFPSFTYMESVMRKIKVSGSNTRIINQEKNMSEENRNAFLNNFQENNSFTLIAMAILGGIFSEGIDLVGDKLIGTMIVGVGLPFLNLERDLLKSYYRKQNINGFNYAYRYPAFNRVLQAGGRIIRTESDKGIIILIDHRFMNNDYKALFPEEWSHVRHYSTSLNLLKHVDKFWNY
ncbi:MAG: ATP-dependent DNA helicase [Candidatus Cloacimonadales bacterium]|jgi:DNA excision repair protein ERCC-2|nr:ATP-dependent DNA helicase [Candidatus Cloacimonadales bacterium]